MNSFEYLRSLSGAEKKGLAKKCNVSFSTVTGVIYKTRKPSVKLALKIFEVTDGKVKKEELRPDIDWTLIVD